MSQIPIQHGHHLLEQLQKLLSISSVAICDSKPNLPAFLSDFGGHGANQLVELLHERNGFYAFEGALHVFPSNCANSESPMDLERWNMDFLWRSEFGSAADGLLFFAEDVFGEQFALSSGSVWRFNPESGAREVIAQDLDEWAGKILADYSVETGFQLAHDWQQKNGQLAAGQRLIPKTPFILGGEYEVDNLFALDAVKAMRYRADIWKQIRDLPDGATVQLKVLW